MSEPDPPADEHPARPDTRRRRFRWITRILGVALLALLIGEGVYLAPQLHESWRQLTEIHWGWLAACVGLQALSMSGIARVQKQLLHAGGVDVTERRSAAVVYGSTAMALTLPAGQVFSTTFTYRQTRRWGASPVVASWQLVFSGAVAAAGLAVLGVAGAVLVGKGIGVRLVLTLLLLGALIAGGVYLARHPGTLEAGLRRVVGWLNRLRKKPADHGMHKIGEIREQLEAVQLSSRDGVGVTCFALVHRLADVACLGAACYAVGADPRLSGLLIAFTAGKAVGSIPFAPGGIVYVDATLIYGLTAAAGLPAAQAVAAAFIYRLVSFILVAIVGWIVFAVRFRKTRAEDAKYEKEFEQHRAGPRRAVGGSGA